MSKSARRTAANVITMPSMKSSPAAASTPAMTDSDIALRTSRLYVDEDREEGHGEHRAERRRIPPCPQCDATNAERVLAVAPESRLRWFRCRGCGHLWSVAPPVSSLP